MSEWQPWRCSLGTWSCCVSPRSSRKVGETKAVAAAELVSPRGQKDSYLQIFITFSTLFPSAKKKMSVYSFFTYNFLQQFSYSLSPFFPSFFSSFLPPSSNQSLSLSGKNNTTFSCSIPEECTNYTYFKMMTTV